MKSKRLPFVSTMVILIGCSAKRNFNTENAWKHVDLNVNSDAKIISQDPAPKYPKEATAERKSGSAEITLFVDEFGNPRNITIVKESPEGYGFGPSAVNQASKLVFVPAVHDGKRVGQRFKRTYNFNYSSNGKSYYDSKEKTFTFFDLTYCTDPQLSFWASRVRREAYINADSIAKVDSVPEYKCSVRFIVDQSGEIFNLEKNDCDLGYKSIKKMEHTPPLPAGFKPDTIMVTLEFNPRPQK